MRRALKRLRRAARFIGPGFVTGVADDDPSGIATYSQAGAQFGLEMLWTMPAAYPLMAAVQAMCARIGRVTGRGLAANIRRGFPAPVLYAVVALLLVANVLNIAADVAAMGEAGELVTGIGRHWLTAFFVAVTLLLQVFVPYHRYVVYLKWLTLSLLAYFGVLAAVSVPWGAVALHTLLPRLDWTAGTAAMVVGVFGTTISPYLFFWQASEEVEEMRRQRRVHSLAGHPAAARRELRRIAWDTWGGMAYSNLSSYAIILASAVTLHAAGITGIDTAAQAAAALKPLAGPFAALLFAVGIVGVGLIGVPVLAGSAAYAVAEAMGWPWGLERRLRQARGFYGVIALGTLAALGIQYLPINPMRGLFWSAVINGVVAVPLIVVVLLLAARRSVMGPFVAGRGLLALGWLTALAMGAATLRMVWPF